MGRLTLGPAPVVVVFFALIQATNAEVTTGGAPHQPTDANNGPILPEKKEEVERILAKPPAAFKRLMAAVPFSIYGKDKRNNYIAFCNSQTIDWGIVNDIKPEELSEYIKYLALFFWKNVDRRADSSLTVIVDAKGFSLGKVINGSVKAVLDSIVAGLNDTVAYVGERPGQVFLINTPSFLGPILSLVSKLLRTGVDLTALSSREKWEPALKEYVGEEFLPVEYGGTNKTTLEDSMVVKYIKDSVGRLIKQKRAGVKSNL